MDSGIMLKSESCRSMQGLVKMRVSLYDKGSLVKQTVMGLTDYISMLQRSVKREEAPTTLMVGEIPQGFVDGAVSDIPGTLGAIIYVPPQKRQFLLDESGERKKAAYFMPMPGLVYMCVSNHGNIHTFRCYVFKEWEGDKTKLYHYPFGNVSDSGSICMGSVKKVKISDFMDIRKNIEQSLTAVTNRDYLDSGLCRTSVTVTQHELCDQVSKMDEFPSEILLENTELPTVKDLKQEFRNILTTL